MILCTMPGKHGDILWSLPTVRAISETYREPVDFVLSKETPSILPLLRLQPYIRSAELIEPWYDHPTEAGTQIRPAPSPTLNVLSTAYDRVFHLSYRGWPQAPLPMAIRQNALIAADEAIVPLDLARPWIAVPDDRLTPEVVVGFNDEHFELKYGLGELLNQREVDLWVTYPAGSRWENEGGWAPDGSSDWIQTAEAIKGCQVVLADCSATHVLAVAMGKPVVMMEPSPARWNPIFYPLGTMGPEVTLVLGNDGKPTWDARHVYDALLPFL